MMTRFGQLARFLFLTVVLSVLIPSNAKGDPPPVELPFLDVWSLVKENSISEKAAFLEFEAIQIEKERISYENVPDTLYLYHETLLLFGTFKIFQKESSQLESLSDTTRGLLENYRIGVKRNPLGYSGLLGLKSVANRIKEAISENDSRIRLVKNTLEERGVGLPKRWIPAKEPGKESILTFADYFLKPNKNSFAEKKSPRAEMMFAEAQASELQIEGEKAKTRPQVGLFSEGYLADGNRDAAASYVLGLYFRWNLLSSETYRKTDQARISASALKARAEDFQLQEKIEFENASVSASALRQRIALLEENTALLEEQLKTSQKLFASGSINVLQLVEVINQKLDLNIRLGNAEAEYVQAKIVQAKGSGVEIPFSGKRGPYAE
ncbi:MAG: TolC family protein [Nitrospirae bacterium]|nr:TolC family protein [Nitrospirota bacterium]